MHIASLSPRIPLWRTAAKACILLSRTRYHVPSFSLFMPLPNDKNIGKQPYPWLGTPKPAKSPSHEADFRFTIDEDQVPVSVQEPSANLYSKADADRVDRTLHSNVPSAEQPREKFLRLGPQHVSNIDLIAIMLRTGTPEMNVLDTARFIYERYGCSLLRMGQATVSDLSQIHGMGEAKSIAFAAALELGRRRSIEELDGMKILTSEDCYRFFKPRLAHISWEELHVVAVDARGGVIGERLIAKGGLNGTLVDLRILMGEVVRMSGQAFMVAHNHPSGSSEPSRQDRDLTERIAKAARTLDVHFLDHIIVPCGSAGDTYYSFADNGFI